MVLSFIALAKNNIESEKRVVIGIVAFTILWVFFSFDKRGMFSKKKKFKYKTNKRIIVLNQKLYELKILHSKGILTEQESIEKSSIVKKEIEDYQTELKLVDNKKFQLIKKSYAQKLITEAEMNTKIDQIRKEINLSN